VGGSWGKVGGGVAPPVGEGREAGGLWVASQSGEVGGGVGGHSVGKSGRKWGRGCQSVGSRGIGVPKWGVRHAGNIA
jgi:hypothetical protein